jgi:hypothetical protein
MTSSTGKASCKTRTVAFIREVFGTEGSTAMESSNGLMARSTEVITILGRERATGNSSILRIQASLRGFGTKGFSKAKASIKTIAEE